MTKTYNSPPNWPKPPEGWMPSPGWQPDPSWGPAPPGWQFWIELPDKTGPTAMAIPSSAGDHELRIFLSYRRTDCQAQANGLYDGLRNRLPEARVFMDIDGIPAGVDFVEQIRRETAMCDVVLVMIGDNWLDPRPGTDVRRIDEPEDFVRLEIESALAGADVRTVPVLVEKAQMPRSNELPESIARLARIQAFELDDMRWRADLDRLVDLVEAIGREKGKLTTPEPGPSTETAPAPAPVARTSMSVAAVGNVGLDPGEVPAALVEPRTPPVAYVMMALPVLTFALGAWAPPLWAGLKRATGNRSRAWLFVVSAALAVTAIAGFAMIGTAPEDADGSATGVWSDIGVVLILGVMIAGTAVAVIFRKPPGPRQT